MTFKTRYACSNHLREQHSGISWKCGICHKIFRRNTNPHQCRALEKDFYLFSTISGASKEEARVELELFENRADHKLIQVVCLDKFNVPGAPPPHAPTRKRTNPEQPYSGKRQRGLSVTSSSSSSATSSSSSSRDSSAERHLDEIGRNSELQQALSGLQSYQEATGLQEPMFFEEEEGESEERRERDMIIEREKREKEERERREREENERREKERKENEEKERREKERREKDLKEKERKEKERKENEEKERKEKERRERDLKEKERKEKEEKERQERERRDRKEKEEQERREKEKRENEIREREAKERQEKEKKEREEREKEIERKEKEEKAKREKEEKEKKEKEKKEKEEKAKKEKEEKEKKEKERKEIEEKDRKEREEKERREKERIEREEKERKDKEKKDKERREKEEREKEKEEKEKMEKNENWRKRRTIRIAAPTSQKLGSIKKDQEETVKFNVGGRQFVTCKRTITGTPNLLAKMFVDNSPLSPLKDNIFLDREPKMFEQFLYFLRTGELYSNSCEELRKLRVEAKYFDCKSLEELIEKRMTWETGVLEE